MPQFKTKQAAKRMQARSGHKGFTICKIPKKFGGGYLLHKTR